MSGILEAEAARIRGEVAALGRFYLFPLDHPGHEWCQGVGKHHKPHKDGERGKHPACKWSEWSTQDPDKLGRYFGSRAFNIGIDCGKSGLLVVDEDTEGEWDRLCQHLGVDPPETVTVQTSRGRHIYFRQPADPLGNSDRAIQDFKINIRGKGGLVVAPGSLHETGVIYKVTNKARIIPAPDWLIRTLQGKTSTNGQADTRVSADDRAWWREGPIRAGKRHDAIVAAAGWALRLGIHKDEARPLVRDVLARCEGDKYTWDDAEAQLDDIYDRYPAGHRLEERRNGETSTDIIPSVPVLPDKFWEARPTTLGRIRQAAHSRQRSADAVFHTVLTRVSALAPHTLRIPPMVGSAKPLSYFVAIVAASGGGKSSANDIATELLPAFGDVLDQIPPGSGEGLAELLFDMVEETDSCGKTIKVKKQVRHAAIVYIDEGQILGEIGGRKGATLLPSLRTIYTGGPLGQANANKERFRVVPGGSYVFGVSVGFQMTTAAVLLEDVAAGTPQRFGWASAEDPTIERCDWPGPLEWEPINRRTAGQTLTFTTEIEDEVRATDLAKNRREITPDPLDSHADLYRLKVSALLAILDGRRDVNLDDWGLAGIVRKTSDDVRTMVGNSVTAEAAWRERATSAKLAQRAAHSDAAVHQRRVIDTARKIAGRVWDQTGPYLVSQMRRDVRRYPDGFDDAIIHAVAEGWIVETSEPVVGAGGEKPLLVRGETPT
jgi:Bifunctional DNA primase/polymerase, N-terminal